MRVPLLDLTLQYRQVAADIQRVIPEVVESQQFILGPRVDRFEDEVARHLGATDVRVWIEGRTEGRVCVVVPDTAAAGPPVGGARLPVHSLPGSFQAIDT